VAGAVLGEVAAALEGGEALAAALEEEDEDTALAEAVAGGAALESEVEVVGGYGHARCRLELSRILSAKR